MPDVTILGHFAVVSSLAKPSKWGTGIRRVALLEIIPEHVKMAKVKEYPQYEYPLIQINTRLKCVKRIIFKSRNFYTMKNPDYWAHRRCMEKWTDMAEHFDKLWPCHFLAKGWPLEIHLVEEPQQSLAL